MKRAFWVFFLGGLTAVSLLTFNGCTTTATGRRQLNFVSKEQEMQLGLTAFEEMKKELPISSNPKYKSLVERVGAKIAEQAKAEMPEAKWEFVVFESPEANAFCLPGGKVGVYTGLLPITQSEAGLATVIGHEVAHATQHHGAERMSTATAVQGVTQAGGALAGEKYSQITMVALGGLGKLGVELPFSRKQESEADQVGLSYMARAGYDPEEAVHFWERFAASHAGQSQGPSLLRTHLVDSQRIADLKKWLPGAKAEYRKDGSAAPKTSSDKGSTVISK
ncbi:MAG TPA: M48 family metallopeptidase [Candidatus Limnocylindria bacterium]|nr:M48 family metallopeptidase [Candidatus Limnocylindria bacterium]